MLKSLNDLLVYLLLAIAAWVQGLQKPKRMRHIDGVGEVHVVADDSDDDDEADVIAAIQRMQSTDWAAGRS